MKGSKLAKGCGFGCLGLIALLVLIVAVDHLTTTPEQREERRKHMLAQIDASEKADTAKVDAFFKVLSELREHLPASDGIREKIAPNFSAQPIYYAAADYGWLGQFSDHGFVADPKRAKPPFYLETRFHDIEESARSGGRSAYLAITADRLADLSYLAVFVPVQERWPVIAADSKSFQSGLFDGWVILMDWKTRRPLGQVRFSAANSEEVRTTRLTVHGVAVLGDDARKAVESDFQDQFWKAANDAIARVCGREEIVGFATHIPR